VLLLGAEQREATQREATQPEAARQEVVRAGAMRPVARAQPTLVQPAQGQGVAQVVQQAAAVQALPPASALAQ